MNKKGFTLIELLVVVLIIGILSAVALPQYTKAVEKSRVAGVWSTLGSLRKVASVYFLEHPETGDSINNMKDLDATLDFTYSGDSCSGANCLVDCPNKGWSECAYMAHQWSEGNVGVSFYFTTKNGKYSELLLDNEGQHCYGSVCKDIGISAND